jgi:beta-galactosidase
MGHDEDFTADDAHKQPRGLTGARILGSAAALSWRVQGNRGGEDLADPVRGPMNAGGLYGERRGWALPGFPDAAWRPVRLPHHVAAPGEAWYRTTFALRVPAGHDVPLGIRIADSPRRRYRALIFVNGWLIGRYVNAVGPQHEFPLPAGIVRADGANTLAIAVWNEGRAPGGLGRVSLWRYANLATSLRIADVASPGYRPA